MNAHHRTAAAPRRRTVAAGAAATIALIGTSVGSVSGATEPSGGADDWESVVAAAEEEGTVVLYTTHLPNQIENLEEAFENAYPDIDLQVQRLLGELAATLEAERTTGTDGADVAVINTPSVIDAYIESGDVLPIGGPSAEAWTDNPAFVDGSYFVANYNALGIAWNTDEVPDGITGFEDLLDPELAGRVGLPDGANGDGSAVTDWYAFLEEFYGGEQYLEDLAAQAPVIFDTAAPLQQAVVVGEIAVAAYAVPSILEEQAKGAPVDFVLPDPAWAAPFDAFGAGWTKRPNAAAVLLDFMMSPEGQTALAVNGASALEGVEGLIPLEQTVPSQVAEREPGFLDDVSGRWREIFGR